MSLSRMFTTCPNCRMNLAVTAGDLRIGQGYVRCGRCDRVFNALLSLSEDLDVEQQSGLAATGTTSVPAIEESQTVATESGPAPAAAAPDERAEWAKITPIRSPAPTPDVDVVESQSTGTFETIVLEGDGFLQTEEHVDEEEVDQQLMAIARQIRDEKLRPEPESLQVDELTGENVILETSDAEAAELALDADAAVGNRPRQHWGWGVAAGALAVLLAGQMVHHNRQALVAGRWLEAPLKGLYRVFGVTLEPKWDLRAYDLRQLGGEAMPGTATTIVLRASVHNRAANSQPPPMIRAVLQDRFGNALSTTDIAPQEYLRGRNTARMAPDQRLDAELSLNDPNRQAVGFELDACLPGADGRLHCSNDR
jgi:predicted Zn finger-like uncharacterized protein